MKIEDAESIAIQMVEKWADAQPNDVLFDGRMVIHVDITLDSKTKIGKVHSVKVTDLRTH
jgi:hypothetical protein